MVLGEKLGGHCFFDPKKERLQAVSCWAQEISSQALGDIKFCTHSLNILFYPIVKSQVKWYCRPTAMQKFVITDDL